MNVSQSALSVQIRKLEERLGQRLFERRNRQLILTEAGRIALDHADTIFATGDDLTATLRRTGVVRQAIRIGALATLSRNFQKDFLRPLLGRQDVELVLRSGGLGELLASLQDHSLDIVLTNQSPPADARFALVTHRISEQAVSLIGHADTIVSGTDWGKCLSTYPLILPTIGTSVRTGFDALINRLNIQPQIAAEVDDMAMMRLLAREGVGIAVLPPIVVKDELATGILVEIDKLGEITEQFLALTMKRRFPNPLVGLLLQPDEVTAVP